MKLFLPLSLLVAGGLAQDGCGFPDGPDCVSLGVGPNGLEQFPDDGCCLLPFRCGNIAGERCERVSADDNAGNGNGNGNGNNRNDDNDAEEEEQEEATPDNGNNVDENCGFPNGPTCESLGEGPNGLEQFPDDGCCLLPFRCGNVAGELCERVSVDSNNGNDNNNNGNGNNGNDDAEEEEEEAADSGNNTDENCGFPNGPDCVSLGQGASGLEQFADDGCCLLPFRCGNGDGGERCERVAVGSQNKARFRRVPRGSLRHLLKY